MRICKFFRKFARFTHICKFLQFLVRIFFFHFWGDSEEKSSGSRSQTTERQVKKREPTLHCLREKRFTSPSTASSIARVTTPYETSVVIWCCSLHSLFTTAVIRMPSSM